MEEFDEKKAAAAMNAALPEGRTPYDDDGLLNIIDMIWDWYEDNGLLDVDAEADDEDVNVNALVSYVRKTLAKDPGAKVDPADVEALVMGEINYEQSLDLL